MELQECFGDRLCGAVRDLLLLRAERRTGVGPKRLRGKRSKSTASPSKGISRVTLRIATCSFIFLRATTTSPNRRYPVVYFLHGYAAHAETYWNIVIGSLRR